MNLSQLEHQARITDNELALAILKVVEEEAAEREEEIDNLRARVEELENQLIWEQQERGL